MKIKGMTWGELETALSEEIDMEEYKGGRAFCPNLDLRYPDNIPADKKQQTIELWRREHHKQLDWQYDMLIKEMGIEDKE